MKKLLLLLVCILTSSLANAYDIEAANSEGVKIYYNYSNDGKELSVTYRDNNTKYSGNIVIPDEVTYMKRTRKVTSIGEGAFYGCNTLISVTIPNSVTNIYKNAFNKCSGLTSITIPNSVTSIGDGAFNGCKGLTSIDIPHSVTSLSGFSSCSGLTSITIPNSVTSIGDIAFYNCYNLTSVTIGSKITNIGYGVFAACGGLTSVEIPNNVTIIGDWAFSGCTGLTSINIGNSVTSIGEGAFNQCKKLSTITIPNSVTSIGIEAFCYCYNLTSVTIPNSVRSIGSRAFYECCNLTSVTIGSNVTNIGSNAFDGRNIYIPTVILLNETPFGIYGKTTKNKTFTLDTFNNATLYVPKGTIENYKATTGWKDFFFIEEGTGGDTPPTPQTCEKPIIGYQNGKLTFICATEGATCQYSITDSDIKVGSGNEVQLDVTYNISVYAAKEGYENSETATATLCWINAAPQTEGIVNDMAQISALPVLIKTSKGFISVEGVDDGTDVSIYTTDGKQVGSAVSQNNVASILTIIQPGSIAIVKVGDKAIKVMMK